MASTTDAPSSEEDRTSTNSEQGSDKNFTQSMQDTKDLKLERDDILTENDEGFEEDKVADHEQSEPVKDIDGNRGEGNEPRNDTGRDSGEETASKDGPKSTSKTDSCDVNGSAGKDLERNSLKGTLPEIHQVAPEIEREIHSSDFKLNSFAKDDNVSAEVSPATVPSTTTTEAPQPGAEASVGVTLPLLTPGRAMIGEIPPREEHFLPRYSLGGQRTNIPPRMVRASAFSVNSSTSRAVSREYNFTAMESSKGRVVTWEEATNSRPPLRIDMDGPTPCTYSPRNKPLMETNSPSFTFGVKCQPEKSGGGRTCWWKSWFQTPHVWLHKVDFMRDRVSDLLQWPSPSMYSKRLSLGVPNPSTPTAPAFTITDRKTASLKFPGVVESPSPSCYSRASADGQTLRRSASFTHGLRRGGTVPWPSTEVTPGPGQYEASTTDLPLAPAFTIQGIRREKSFLLGPYCTF